MTQEYLVSKLLQEFIINLNKNAFPKTQQKSVFSFIVMKKMKFKKNESFEKDSMVNL